MSIDVNLLMETIEKTAQGLLFPSESDYPIVAFRFGPEEPTPEALRQVAGLAPDAAVEETTVESFFEGLTEERFQSLVALLVHELTDLRVARVGSIDIHAFVLGKHVSGEWLGVRTKLVET